MTTSLVAEVLKKSGRFAKEDVCAALDKLSRKIDEVKVSGGPSIRVLWLIMSWRGKGEVNGIVQKQYKEYVAVYADTTELLGRVKGLTGEMQQLSDRMEVITGRKNCENGCNFLVFGYVVGLAGWLLSNSVCTVSVWLFCVFVCLSKSETGACEQRRSWHNSLLNLLVAN